MLLFGATVLTGIVLIGGMIPYLSESFPFSSLVFICLIFSYYEICIRKSLFRSLSELLKWLMFDIPFWFHGC